ncbi:MAG: alpha/beta fold hydrolase [Maribacter sp.]|nr:alpha/beta fold hydrolase [Maribacter sp.]
MPLLHSKILGAGRPLLILHGFLGMSDNWKTMGAMYAENGFCVHLVDLRNHGQSFWSKDFNYDLLTEDLSRYLDHHRLERVSLIGHSMGGKAAMHFACNYPDRVEKLIVADIAPKYYPPHHQAIIEGLTALDFNVIRTRSEADGELKKHIIDIGTRQFLLKNLYWKDKGQLGFRFNLAVLKEKMREIGENIGTTAVYKGPTLFLRGAKSAYIKDNDLAAIRRHFPNATLETIEAAGHWLHAENPKQFFAKSAAFLGN